MALAAFNGQAQDTAGNVVTSFQVEVRDETDGNLAPIYSDLAGTTPLGNPFTPSALDNGYFRFYVNQGRYRIRAFTGGGDVSDWRDVPIGDDIAMIATEVQSTLDDVYLNESSNLSDVDTAVTAFDNIKQSANNSYTGVVEKATDSEVRSAASDKYISADLIESASAGVALSDAATVAVDWDTGINFTLTVTASRTIGNPTNGQPGTWRTILVQGNDGNTRTISFGNQFLGEVPTITDATSSKWYMLMIHCVSSTHFFASAKRAKG
jgi:hypothetical protein